MGIITGVGLLGATVMGMITGAGGYVAKQVGTAVVDSLTKKKPKEIPEEVTETKNEEE